MIVITPHTDGAPIGFALDVGPIWMFLSKASGVVVAPRVPRGLRFTVDERPEMTIAARPRFTVDERPTFVEGD